MVCNADTKTCGLEKFGKYFPEREFSFGIAEQNLVAASAGMAACGNKVFLATFAVFASMRACEQVRTFVCYPNLNVTVIGTHAGLQVGGDGATHAAIEDVSIMRSFPNMTVVQPPTPVAAGPWPMRRWISPAPCTSVCTATRLPTCMHPATYKFEWGKANTVVDNGSDMTMIVSGILLKKALDAGRHPEGAGDRRPGAGHGHHQASGQGGRAEGGRRDRGHHDHRGPLPSSADWAPPWLRWWWATARTHGDRGHPGPLW